MPTSLELLYKLNFQPLHMILAQGIHAGGDQASPENWNMFPPSPQVSILESDLILSHWNCTNHYECDFKINLYAFLM